MHRLDDEMEGKQMSKSVYKEGELYNDPPILIQKEEFEYEFNTDRDVIYKGILYLLMLILKDIDIL